MIRVLSKVIVIFTIIAALSIIVEAALTDTLIAHWKLDEASGNALDALGVETLTDTNTVTAGTGKINGARDFEKDTNEYFVRADDAALSSGDIDFTIAVWVNAETLSATNNNYIIAKSDASTGDEYRLLYKNVASTNRFDFAIIYNSGTLAIEAIANNFGGPSAGVWYYIVAWHDATANTANIQVNNGTVDSITTSGNAPPDGAGGFYIGAYHSSLPLSWDGLIDEVSFWKRVLTSDERTALYNSGNGFAYPWSSSVAGCKNGLLLMGAGC